MGDAKEIRWVGSSYDDLLAFPQAARKEAGFQLGKVQAGLDPTTGNVRRCGRWNQGGSHQRRKRHLPCDVRRQVRGSGYVLHCFQKKGQATSQRDKAIAQARYRAVVNARKARK